MFDPETCIVSILTRESVNEAVCEMDISEEDQEKVMASIGENIIEELAENMGDCSCCNELFDEALQLELGRVAEDVIDGFKSEFHEDLPGNNKQQTEIA
jgi:ATP-dependent RNA circularization protein (DNA/RNA ligase family)